MSEVVGWLLEMRSRKQEARRKEKEERGVALTRKTKIDEKVAAVRDGCSRLRFEGSRHS